MPFFAVYRAVAVSKGLLFLYLDLLVGPLNMRETMPNHPSSWHVLFCDVLLLSRLMFPYQAVAYPRHAQPMESPYCLEVQVAVASASSAEEQDGDSSS